MDTAAVMTIVKARLGISTSVRDAYLESIIKSVITELTDEKGIALDEQNMNHVVFVADYAAWRYQSRDSSGAIPQHIMWRLKNLYLHDGGEDVQP